MDVDVDLAGRDREEDDGARIAAVRHQLAVRAQDRVRERAIPDGPAVDEEPDVARAGVLDGGTDGETVRADAARFAFESEQVAAHLAAQGFFGAPLQDVFFFARRQLHQRTAVFTHREMHVGTRDREPQHGLDALRLLGRGALEELAARGDVPEEVAHFDRGSRRRAGVFGFLRRAGVDFDARAGGGVGFARQQREPADRGHAGERLAAKAVAGDGEEALLGFQLAGRVALQAQERVLAAHAGSVVADRDQPAAAVEEIDLDPGGAGVERVLHQLFDDRRGTLDDFAGGDLVPKRLGEELDVRHCTTQGRPRSGASGRRPALQYSARTMASRSA